LVKGNLKIFPNLAKIKPLPIEKGKGSLLKKNDFLKIEPKFLAQRSIKYAEKGKRRDPL